jgi:hypothetical protein
MSNWKFRTKIKLKIRLNTGLRFLIFFTVIFFFIISSKLVNYNSRYLNEIFSMLVFFTAYYLTPSIRVDKINLVSPKNLMLLIFFVRLVICPITIFFTGFHKWVLPFFPNNEELYKAYLITVLAFISFVIGWDLLKKSNTETSNIADAKFKFRNNAVIAAALFAMLFFLIFFFYGSIAAYLRSFYLEDYLQYQENSGKLLIYFSIMAKYGISFLGIIVGFYAIDRIKGGVWIKGLVAFFSIILIIILSMGPSRNNMVFPVLAFLAASIPKYFRIRYRDFIFGCIAFILFAFVFQNYRKHVNEQIISQLNKADKFIEFVQVYFDAPHIMTPIFRLKEGPENKVFTLHSSLLETIPVLGTPFRDKSGSYIFNLAYDRIEGRDQVFPTSAEVYFNLGWIGVIVVFLLTGFLYRKINDFFLNYTLNDPVFRATVFYLTLVFNATIFYSYSVLGQLIFYNSIIVILIMVFRDRNHHEITDR